MLFGKTKAAASSASAGEPEAAGPLDGVRVEGGRFVFEGEPFEETAGAGDGSGGVTIDRLKALYPPEKFHKHLIDALGATGRRYGYQSLHVDTSDEAFRAASDEIYRYLADSPFSAALEWMGDEHLQRLFIVAYGTAPIVVGVWRERKAKRRAAAAPPAPAMPESPTVETGGAGSEKGKRDE